VSYGESMKKNIGIVTTWFERGAAYVSKQFKNALDDEYNVYIYARGGEFYAVGSVEWDKDYVTWQNKTAFYRDTYIIKKSFKKWINDNQISLVIFNEQKWLMPILWCREAGVKTIAYVDYYTKESVDLFDCYDGLICNTKRHFSVFQWHKRSSYVQWGTDIDLYKPREFSTEKNYVTLFHSCGMSPFRKGTDLLIRAVKDIKENFRLVIHSQVDLLKEFPKLNEDIRYLIKNNKLELVVETVSAPGLYSVGDIYIYPSRLDGLGLSLVEAISCGLGVITTDEPPMNEFIDESYGLKVSVSKYVERNDGYYWPMAICDIGDLQKKIEAALRNTTELKKIKKMARLCAAEKYDWKANGVDLVAAVREVINNNENTYDFIKYRPTLSDKFIVILINYDKLIYVVYKVYKKIKGFWN